MRKKSRFLDLLDTIFSKIRVLVGSPQKKPVRVSLEDYRKNLISMATIADKHGFMLIYLTAPHDFDPDILPEYLETMGYIDDFDSLIEMRNAYNEVIRHVAMETGSTHIDLAGIIDRRNDGKKLFLSDGIHLSDTGTRVVAEAVHQTLIETF